MAKSAVLLAACFLMATSIVSADTKPYVKMYGADLFTGGWFNNVAASCVNSANYQDPNFKSPADNMYGGILTWAKTQAGGVPNGGSSVEYGAFANGLINTDASVASRPRGFYSSSNQSHTEQYLSFANNNSGSVGKGGLFQGANRQSNCIPDYYGTKLQLTASSINTSPMDWSSAAGQYVYNAGGSTIPYSLVPGDITIASGDNITVFVNGNVYIGHNIVYETDYTADTVPKFAVVVKGSIYVDPSVTQLDGLYIAQPNNDDNTAMSRDTGVFWSCYDIANPPPKDDLPNKCINKLTVNGAVVAKQLNLLRSFGDIASASAVESRDSNNAAEVFNYTPEMVVGGPFFSLPPSNTLKVQSLVSLPPVF